MYYNTIFGICQPLNSKNRKIFQKPLYKTEKMCYNYTVIGIYREILQLKILARVYKNEKELENGTQLY